MQRDGSREPARDVRTWRPSYELFVRKPFGTHRRQAFELALRARESGALTLHGVTGQVTFPATIGNIGASDRLDFTVIGAAVNEAARIEALCKDLGVPLLISDDVAAKVEGPSLRSLGRHSLRGVAADRELFSTTKPA